MIVRKVLALLFTVAVCMANMSCSSDDNIFVDDKPCNFDDLKNKAISPGDDFFRYCNGSWYDSTVIPDGVNNIGFLQTEQSAKAPAMLKEQLTNPTLPLLKTLKANYDRRNETADADYSIIRSYMDDIDRQATMHDLLLHAGHLVQQDMPSLISPTFTVQNKMVKVVFDYSGFQKVTIPVEDICLMGYTEEDAQMMLSNADKISQDIVKTVGATLSIRESFNKPMSDDEYSFAVTHCASRASNPADNISVILSGMGLSPDVLYDTKGAFINYYGYINSLKDEQLAATKDYMKLVVAQYLLPFTAYGKGTYASQFNNNPYLVHVLSKLFADSNHTSQSKQYIETMCENIRTSLINRIGRLDWMVDNTKRAAADKVADMQFFCCYPEKWNDALLNPAVSGKSYLQDMLELAKQFNGVMISECGRTDRDALWDVMLILMPMYVINACYIPDTNFIIITAAISCAPLVDINKSDAYNYGAIATIVGHEMTHGLDSQGSKYDKDGYLYDWWTLDDKLKFKERQQQLITIYNNLVVVPGIFQNGEQTLGENIADLGGSLAAYDSFVALRKSQGCKGEELNAQKRLFLESYASLWRDKRTTQGYMIQQKNDVHANGICRINGVVCNHPDWYMLYDVRPNHKLYLAPERRVSIW